MSDSFFPICQKQVPFENTEITSHLAETEAHPWGLPGLGSSRVGKNNIRTRPGTHGASALTYRRFSPPSTPGAAFSTLGFNFPLCLDTGRRAGLRVSMSPIEGPRDLGHSDLGRKQEK